MMVKGVVHIPLNIGNKKGKPYPIAEEIVMLSIKELMETKMKCLPVQIQ